MVSVCPGDVAVRAGSESWIAELTEHPWTHSGIGVYGEDIANATGDLKNHAVNLLRVQDFFADGSTRLEGEIYQFAGPIDVARSAANWAMSWHGKKLKFSFLDDIGNDHTLAQPITTYCASFVWRCYYFGSQNINGENPVQLVPIERAHDLKRDDETYEKAIKLITDFASRQYPLLGKMPYKAARDIVERQFANHSGRFISPGQIVDFQYGYMQLKVRIERLTEL